MYEIILPFGLGGVFQDRRIPADPTLSPARKTGGPGSIFVKKKKKCIFTIKYKCYKYKCRLEVPRDEWSLKYEYILPRNLLPEEK